MRSTILKKAAFAATNYISSIFRSNAMNRVTAIFQENVQPPQAARLRLLNEQRQEAFIPVNEDDQVVNGQFVEEDIRQRETLLLDIESDLDNEHTAAHRLSSQDLLAEEKIPQKAPIDMSFSQARIAQAALSFPPDDSSIVDALEPPQSLPSSPLIEQDPTATRSFEQKKLAPLRNLRQPNLQAVDENEFESADEPSRTSREGDLQPNPRYPMGLLSRSAQDILMGGTKPKAKPAWRV